jgi:hypothetical protein
MDADARGGIATLEAKPNQHSHIIALLQDKVTQFLDFPFNPPSSLSHEKIEFTKTTIYSPIILFIFRFPSSSLLRPSNKKI